MNYFIFNDAGGDTVQNSTKRWNPVTSGLTDSAVVDKDNLSTGFTLSTGTLVDFPNASGDPFPGFTGDGSWYDEDVDEPIWLSNATYVEISSIGGLDSGKTYIVEVLGGGNGTGRKIEVRINGGTSETVDISLSNTNNVTANFTLTGVTSATIEARKAATSSGNGYVHGFRLYELIPDPVVTTTDTLQPGSNFTLTATNYASTPVSPVTLTPLDTNGDVITGITPITVAVTITGSGPYTATGTMPTLAEAVTAGTSIPFGSTRISLST